MYSNTWKLCSLVEFDTDHMYSTFACLSGQITVISSSTFFNYHGLQLLVLHRKDEGKCRDSWWCGAFSILQRMLDCQILLSVTVSSNIYAVPQIFYCKMQYISESVWNMLYKLHTCILVLCIVTLYSNDCYLFAFLSLPMILRTTSAYFLVFCLTWKRSSARPVSSTFSLYVSR